MRFSSTHRRNSGGKRGREEGKEERGGGEAESKKWRKGGERRVRDGEMERGRREGKGEGGPEPVLSDVLAVTKMPLLKVP